MLTNNGGAISKSDHQLRAKRLCPTRDWKGARGGLLRKLVGTSWRGSDYDRLFLLAHGDTASLLYSSRTISRELVTSLWNTPVWLHAKKMARLLSARDVEKTFGQPANLRYLLTVPPPERDKIVQALAKLTSASQLKAQLRRLRTSSAVPKRPFPKPPALASDALRPITSYAGFQAEAHETGVEFDAFWLDSAMEQVAAFFSWLGSPRATVLVVYNRTNITHIECRKAPDVELTAEESEPIVAHVLEAFRKFGRTLPKSAAH